MANYVECGGGVPLRQPYAISGVTGFVFGLRGDEAKIHRLCEQTLDTGGEYTFDPPTGLVLFCFLKMRSLRSGSPPDDAKGCIRETELNVAVPLLMRKRGELLPRLVFYMPYLWVDSGPALIAGREVYGFPKQLAAIEMPSALGEPAIFSVTSEVITHFGPGEMCAQKVVASVRRVGGGGVAGEASLRDRVEDAFDDMVERVFGVALPPPLDTVIPSRLRLGQMLSVVFLKQFRCITRDGSQACYRSVAQAPFEITAFRRGQPLAGDYEVEIPKHDSVPLAKELGFAAVDATGLARQKARFAYFADYDFRLGSGNLLWVAP